MKRTIFKLIATLGAVGLIAGLLASMASAHIGASSSASTTIAPDLRSATIVSVGLEQVRFCFDETIHDPTDTLFHLQGYPRPSVEEIEATGDDVQDDGGCPSGQDGVLVTFGGTILDINQYTIAWAEDGAVDDASGGTATGLDSVQNSTTLVGSVATGAGTIHGGGSGGRTAGPDLTGAVRQASPDLEEIVFTFDERLDQDDLDCSPGSFGYYETTDTGDSSVTDGGNTDTGDTCDVTGATARIDFGSDVPSSFRVWVDEGGVFDEEDDSGDQLPNPIGSSSTATESPDLTAVTRVNDTTYRYTFDADASGLATTDTECDPTNFHLYEEDTFPYDGDTCDVTTGGEGATTVEVSFPATDNSSSFEIPLGAVTEGAITPTDSADTTPDGSDTNTIGARGVTTSGEDDGHTDGPDLHDAVFDNNFNNVTFRFDENVDDATLSDTEFCLLNEDGTHTDCATDATASGNQVFTSGYPAGTVAAAAGATVDENAADDFLGNESPEATVGRGVSQTTTTTTTTGTATTTTTTGTATTTATGTATTTTATGTATTTTTGTATTTTTGTATTTATTGPRTRRIATSLTIRYNRRSRAFKGSIGSSRKRCQTQRLVTLLKRGRSRGTDMSNRSGNYKINKRRARGRFKTRVDRKVFTANNGDTIICLKDTSPTIRVGRRRR